MKPETLKRIKILLIGFFMLTTAAAIQAQQSSFNARFTNWDKDRNHKLTHAEFYEGMRETGIFEAWDKSGDRLLDRQEVYAGKAHMQQIAEKNNKQPGTGGQGGAEIAGVSRQESSFSLWNTAAAEEAGFSFREVDLNRDGTLDKTEFFTALFRLWDQEKTGYLRSHELKEATLKQWLLV
jgi:Ca2+-binding EF-hand superfamily protein